MAGGYFYWSCCRCLFTKISPTIHHHSCSTSLWALIVEKLCCVSSVVLPLPDLSPPLLDGWRIFYTNTNSYVFTCVTSPSCPNSIQIVSALCLLARCDWVTAFTGMKWKCTYLNKQWCPEIFKSLILEKCFSLSSDLWRAYSLLICGQFSWNLDITLKFTWQPGGQSGIVWWYSGLQI